MKKGLVAVGLLLLVSCVSTVKCRVENPLEPGQADVLIAAEQSAFKQALVESVIDRLSANGRTFRVVGLKNLSLEPLDEYDAMVIVSAVRSRKLRPQVRTFLDGVREDQKNKIILVTSAGNPQWNAEETGVDAVTSASTLTQVDHTLDFIVGQVMLRR